MMNSKNATSDFWKLAGIVEPLLLASSSPRRAALLQAIGIPFEVAIPVQDDEGYDSWDGGELLLSRAVKKAQSVRHLHPHRMILAADTVVVVEDQVLGKPADTADAQRMLGMLSGRSHDVYTALCLFDDVRRRRQLNICRTRVTFKKLKPAWIHAYLQSGEPLDKAGAYGIQGLGGLWIDSIQGCYYNVVGLPLSLLWDFLSSGEEDG
jgi:septum formation protein